MDCMEMKNEMLKFNFNQNIYLIVQYHNQLNALIGSHIAKINDLNPTIDAKVTSEVYKNTFYPQLRNTCLLLLMSHFEEACYLLWKSKAKETELDKKKYSIRKYKPVLEKIGTFSNVAWNTITDAEKVRHCLLHCYGRLSLYNDKKAIEEIIKKYNDELEINLDRIDVKEKFIQRVVDSMRGLLNFS